MQVKNGKKCLVDRFDDTGVWIGAFYKGKLVSCLRMLSRDRSGPLDIEGYKSSKAKEVQNVLQIENIVECQRCVTKKQVRGLGLNCLVLAIAGKICIPQNISAIATSQSWFNTFDYGDIVYDEFDYGDGVLTNVIHYTPETMKGLFKLLMIEKTADLAKK